MTDTELSTMLKDLADAPAPPPRIDIDRARRAGGRRRRVRTTALVLGCAAVVAAGGVTAVSVSRPSVPAATDAVGTALPPTPDPSRDPIVAKTGFGWLPEEVAGIGYSVGAHGDTTEAVGRGEQPPQISLSVSDQEPPVPGELGDQATRIPVRIGDRDGYWLTSYANDPLNHGQSHLRWRTPDGRWAELLAFHLTGPDRQQVLVRVAEHAVFADRPVPLPLRIAGLPGTFRLEDGFLTRRPDTDGVPWRVMLAYASNGTHAEITVSVPGGRKTDYGSPLCTKGNSLQACVRIDQPAAAGIDAQSLLDRITLLGPDEAKWTTHVIG
ncbi:hypothetical protein AB0C38_22645 [Amycolatopsis sp. NPDC048633]|uniref:hypothetical protein n=1 Tax=Amycolatopsis sp. NPDC048633 TaxID=3157095 RepID=UPI0033D2069F